MKPVAPLVKSSAHVGRGSVLECVGVGVGVGQLLCVCSCLNVICRRLHSNGTAELGSHPWRSPSSSNKAARFSTSNASRSSDSSALWV